MRVARTIPKLELLYLAGLFHDIGKGRGGDHSLIGSRDAWDFCQLHGLSDYDSRLVAWLVEKHLIMSMTAQHKDTGDPEVIQKFAAQIGDPTRLDYLYLLTVADARATNPQRWSSWKDSLLRDLYHATRRALVRGLDNPQAQDDLIQQKQTEALRLLSKYGVTSDACKALWIKFSLDYFLHNSPDEIAWQTRTLLGAADDVLPLVAIRPLTHRGGTEIFIYTQDREHLFARTTALLDRWGMSIMDARIMTTDDGMALNAYYVLEMTGSSPVLDEEHVVQIKQALVDELSGREAPDLQVTRPVPRQLRHFPTETKLSFSADEAQPPDRHAPGHPRPTGPARRSRRHLRRLRHPSAERQDRHGRGRGRRRLLHHGSRPDAQHRQGDPGLPARGDPQTLGGHGRGLKSILQSRHFPHADGFSPSANSPTSFIPS